MIQATTLYPGTPVEPTVTAGTSPTPDTPPVVPIHPTPANSRELHTNRNTLTTLIRDTPAAGLLGLPGIGPVTAAVVLAAWSHSEAKQAGSDPDPLTFVKSP